LNNNLAEPKRGMVNYNPCSRYDYVYKTMVHNMNYATRRADSDGTMDESSWRFGGYIAECRGCLIEKKVPKGGQTQGHTSIVTSFQLRKHDQMVSLIRDLQKWWKLFHRLII
jgi:hypothetical protein